MTIKKGGLPAVTLYTFYKNRQDDNSKLQMK